MLSPLINDIDRQGKHNRCVLLDTYLRQSLQVAELDRGRLRFQNFRGIREFLPSFEPPSSMNKLCAAFAFGFRLPCDGALHLLGDVDLFHLDFGNLNAPRLRVRVEYDLELGVDLIALREYFIKFELSDDASNGGLRELRSRIGVVLHLRKRLIGVDHAEVANRIDLHRDVVARDDVLRRNVERLNPHVDPIQRFNRPKNQIYARALCLGYQPAEPKYHAALPFLDDIDRIPEPDQQQANDQRHPDKTNFHVFLLNVRILISSQKQPHRPAQRRASVLRRAKSGRARLPARAAKIQLATTRHARESCPLRLWRGAPPRHRVLR